MRYFTLFFLLLGFLANAQTADDFVYTLELGQSGAHSIEISGNGNINVDWGDGQTIQITDPVDLLLTHYYVSSVPFTVTMQGSLESFKIKDGFQENRIVVNQWGSSRWTTMEEAFRDCIDVTFTATTAPDLRQVRDMSYMFAGATNFNSDLSSWNVSNVTNMSYMFNNATNFNSDLSSWNVANVTNMSYTFALAVNFNSDISSWNVSNVTDMSSMFALAVSFNADLSSWDVSQVTNMSSMFNFSFGSTVRPFNSDLSSWDVSNVTDISRMFFGAELFNSDLSGWDVSNVVNMDSAFFNASSFDSDLSSWDVSNVTNMSAMFNGATSFNSDLSFWDFTGSGGSIFFLQGAFNRSGLDTRNYDALLSRFVNQNLMNLRLGVQSLEFCNNFSRDILIQRGWQIDGDSRATDCSDNNLNGTIYFDSDINGCDSSDVLSDILAIEINNGTSSLTVFSNNGYYEINLPSGTYSVTPYLDNALFSINQASTSVTLSNATSVTQDFCFIATAPVDNLEISILPLEEARPGFDTNYKLIYKNKGNTQLSGSIDLTYEDDFMDFQVATPAETTSNTGLLSWDFSNLDPFETREIEFMMNLNTPTDTTFPLNSNDLLDFTATINPTNNDDTPSDNVFDLQQTVVNSYDPNDKTCLQGNQITPDKVGDYVHYRIRFENEGTASAVNVKIIDYIDLTKFDISTLTPLSASHDYTAKITEGNKVEFSFDDIQLPFTAPESQGYVLFKIKTLDTLVLGDDFSNEAEIYFDFNFPIVTNLATTTVANTLSTPAVNLSKVKLYPNPAKDSITVNNLEGFDRFTIYDISGKMLIHKEVNNTISENVDLKSMNTGLYFMELNGNSISTTLKFIVE